MAWPVIAGMIGSMAGGAAGGYAQNAASKEAAQFQLEATDKNIALQKWLNEAEQTRYKPFSDLGTAALPELEARRMGTFDIMASPYARGRQTMLDEGMARQMGMRGGGPSSYGYRNALQNLGASEEGLGYERALDRVRIGQGNAAQAGQQYGQYANALATAYQQAGNVNSALTNSLADQRNQLYGDLINTAAGYPAANYLYNQRKKQQRPAYGYDSPLAAEGPTADDWRF